VAAEGGRVGFTMANERARELRKSMTAQEVKLWVHLRTWRHRGYHFRRQAPCDGYILNFVCLRRRLIIEVDGGQHNLDGIAMKDRLREQHFERQSFKILRFWNHDVDANLAGVFELIDSELHDRSAPTPALRADPPPAGEG
jgi:very-short-patch-repair endonuclease